MYVVLMIRIDQIGFFSDFCELFVNNKRKMLRKILNNMEINKQIVKKIVNVARKMLYIRQYKGVRYENHNYAGSYNFLVQLDGVGFC